jgi:hypothetical protein
MIIAPTLRCRVDSVTAGIGKKWKQRAVWQHNSVTAVLRWRGRGNVKVVDGSLDKKAGFVTDLGY